MFDRAVRLWAMSPTSATVSPSICPRRWRIVRMSSRPCVGCSCGPSPALITEQPRFWAKQLRRAGRAMPHDDDIDAHRLDVLGRVDERLALGQAASRRRKSRPCRRPAAGRPAKSWSACGSSSRRTDWRSSCPSSSDNFCWQPPVASLNITAVSRITLISSAERLSKIQANAGGSRRRESLRFRRCRCSLLANEGVAGRQVILARLLATAIDDSSRRSYDPPSLPPAPKS